MSENIEHAADHNAGSLSGGSLSPASSAAPPEVMQPRVFPWRTLWRGELPLLRTIQTIYGERRLDSLGGSYGWSVRYRQVEDYERLGITTLAEYIDLFCRGTVRLPYLRHMSINRALPALRQFIAEPDDFKPNWASHPWLDRIGGPELFIGQSETVFGNVHQDQVAVHVGFVQLEGEKEFVMFPPEDGQYLYPFAGRQFPYELRNSEIHFNDLENYERFPLLRKASPRRLRLKAGEAMFLPADWWHTTRNITDSISYSVRIVNTTNVLTTIGRHLSGIPRAFQRKAFTATAP